MKEIDAYIYGKKIGTMLEYDGFIWFEYDKKFKLDSLEISPIKMPTKKFSTPQTNQEHKDLYKGMFGVFFDSLPDKHGMPFIDRYFEKKDKKPYEINLLDKLAFIGNRGMGAIEYITQEKDDNISSDFIVNAKEAYEQMKENIESKNSSIQSLMNIRDSVSPVGGGRPKMLVQYNYKTNKIRLNSSKLYKGFTRAIIKFDEIYEGVGSIGLTTLEYIFMTMAKKAGINTAQFELIFENKAKHLLVKRFDRDEDDAKIHMCTASGLMHIDISIPQATSYEYLFILTRKLCKNQKDIEELYKRMIFNILIFNFDDHAKNFAYLMDKEGKWSLSPAYDITYSKGQARQHLTTIAGKALDITRADVLEIAKRQTIRPSIAKKIIDDCIEVVKTFKETAQAVGLDKEEISNCWVDIQSQIELLKTKSEY